jgi:hypothetical protein
MPEFITLSTAGIKFSEPDYPEEVNVYTEDYGRNYAERRISQIFHKKYEELQDKFHFWEKKPQSLKEMKEWLDKKEYTISDNGLKEDADFSDTYSTWKSHFRWGKPFDQEGFDKAMKELETKETASLDVVAICEDEEKRLQAIKDFENTLQ